MGKLIDSSGIPKLMVGSGLIAEGSLKGVLGGTHFNRCKKIHPAAALSFKILHFKAFLHEYEKEDHESKLHVYEVIDILRSDSCQKDSRYKTFFELTDIISHYDAYTKKTMNGEHGYTAKYVLSYVRWVELYQLFERAIRTSDLDLYIYAAYNMSPLFFIFNHHNYARWLTRNLNDLMNIESTHPGLKTQFENGGLSVRRKEKNFCRSPTDITLEQTINANAANKLTGISAFTNSINARQKWSETHTPRTAVIAELLEFLNLTKLCDSTESEYQSKLFQSQVLKFTEEVEKNINPFSDDLNRSKLFNLSSGKAASPETTEFLLNVEVNGLKQMQTFIKECINDKDRFDRPMKKNVVKNFSVEIFKSKKSSVRHVDQTKAERNILGQVLCLAVKGEIDLSSLFSHPLTTVPHLLAHFDGSMLSNNQKGELTTIFTSKISDQNNNSPIAFDVDIIDGFYLLNSYRESPTKYGSLSTYLLSNICDTSAQEVHIIFDSYQSPSPRDVDMKKNKELYDNFTMNFSIQGPNQERTSSLAKCLSSDSFRMELVTFLIEYWSKEEISGSILNGKRVFLSFRGKCHLFCNDFEKGKLLTTFGNNHFEVESQMIFHMSKIFAMNIRIQTPNPDSMLVYSLYHMQFLPQQKEIWIQTGDIHRNTVNQINVRSIFRTLSPSFINALPAWYVFTGCLYEPSFYGKGRKTCIKLLETNVCAQAAFGNIGSNGGALKQEEIAALEDFTCSLYGNKSKDVNYTRVKIFEKGYGSNVDLSKKGIVHNLKNIL